jgi:anti-sigma regulatory factor (Ser/Thr protein kinase)
MVSSVPTTAVPAAAGAASASAVSPASTLTGLPSPVDVAFVRDKSRVEQARRSGVAWLQHACHMTAVRVGSVEVVISELISNAVVHGCGSTVGFRIRHTEGQVRLEVNDHSPSAVPCSKEAGLDAEGGRGLWLVDALVHELGGEWGFTDDGTVAWCVFPVVSRLPCEGRDHAGEGQGEGPCLAAAPEDVRRTGRLGEGT